MPPFMRVPEWQRDRFIADLYRLFEAQQQPRGWMLLHSMLAAIYVDFLATSEPNPDESMPDWLLRGVKSIELRIEDNICVSDLAKVCGRSPEHVSRSFKRYLGYSPSMYINKQRLDRAALLLTNTNRSILDICFGLGFSSPSYFYRLFKAAYGIPPMTYRKKKRVRSF